MAEKELQPRDLSQPITRRQTLKLGGIAAVGLAFTKPLIDTIYPKLAFANYVVLGPTLDLDASETSTGYSGAFVEREGSVSIADTGDVSISSPVNIQRATIILTNRPDGTDETLSVSGALPAGVVISDGYDNSDGILELSGAAAPPDYETALGLVRYDNTSDNPDPANRTITVVVQDANAIDSDPSIATISVTPDGSIL